jgi:DNA-binding NarL/FixJ family response regulator
MRHPRRQQAYELALEGLSNKEIAARMDITRRAVNDHLSHVFRDHGVLDTRQLLAKRIKELEKLLQDRKTSGT